MRSFDAFVVGGTYLIGSSGKQVSTSTRSRITFPDCCRMTFDLDGKISVSLNMSPSVCITRMINLQNESVSKTADESGRWHIWTCDSVWWAIIWTSSPTKYCKYCKYSYCRSGNFWWKQTSSSVVARKSLMFKPWNPICMYIWDGSQPGDLVTWWPGDPVTRWHIPPSSFSITSFLAMTENPTVYAV